MGCPPMKRQYLLLPRAFERRGALPINLPIILSGNIRYHVSIREGCCRSPPPQTMRSATGPRQCVGRARQCFRILRRCPRPETLRLMLLVPAAPVSARSITTAWSALRISARLSSSRRSHSSAGSPLATRRSTSSSASAVRAALYSISTACSCPSSSRALGRGVLAGVEAVDLAANLARPQCQFHAFLHGVFSDVSSAWAGVQTPLSVNNARSAAYAQAVVARAVGREAE